MYVLVCCIYFENYIKYSTLNGLYRWHTRQIAVVYMLVEAMMAIITEVIVYKLVFLTNETFKMSMKFGKTKDAVLYRKCTEHGSDAACISPQQYESMAFCVISIIDFQME